MSKRTLLLADDSVTIQKVVNLTFADEGIDVVTVGDGDSAMEKIGQAAPDVLLLDVHMPGLNGYQICEIVRQNSVTKDIPVILLVGSFEPFDESEAARVGASAYLTKPFQSIRQLVSQVTELMDASQHKTEPDFADEPEVSDAPSEGQTFEEAQRANPPATEDIDSLYHQSFSGPTRPEVEVDSATARYVDAGMDDEMIETSSFAPPVQDAAPASDSPYIENAEESYREPVSEYNAKDERPELQAASENNESGYPAIEPMPEPDNSDAQASKFRFQETSEEPAYEAQEPGSPARANEIGAAVSSATADAFSEYDEFSRTEQMPAFENPTASSGSFDDDLLDLPPIENGNTLEFTAKQPGTAGAGGKQVVSLSPELMELIVQKVVEKLSDKN